MDDWKSMGNGINEDEGNSWWVGACWVGGLKEGKRAEEEWIGECEWGLWVNEGKVKEWWCVIATQWLEGGGRGDREWGCMLVQMLYKVHYYIFIVSVGPLFCASISYDL